MPSVEISEEELAELRARAESAPSSKKAGKGKTAKAFESGEDELAARFKAAQDNLKNSAETPFENLREKVHVGSVATYGGWTKPTEFDIELPSGTRCRAKKLSMEDAMSLGLLDSLDMFTSALMKPILDAEPKDKADDSQKQLLSSLKDPEKRSTFFGTVNRIVAHTVVIPKVVMQTDAEGNVAEGEVFAGDIPFTDKMFIFNAVFGNEGKSIASFREGPESGVAAVATDPSV